MVLTGYNSGADGVHKVHYFLVYLCIRASDSNIYSAKKKKKKKKRYILCKGTPFFMCWTLPLGSRIAPDIKVLLETTKNYGNLSVIFLVSPQ